MEHSRNQYILAIETSESICSVAVGNHLELLGEVSLRGKNIHNERLSHYTDVLLRDLAVPKERITHIGISAGPGSYTGLRIGFSFGRGMQFALKNRLVPIPTPEIYAWTARFAAVPILAVINAHRGEVYSALYRWKGNVLEELEHVTVRNIEALVEEKKNESLLVVGSGIPVLYQVLGRRIPRKWKTASTSHQLVRASDLYHYMLELIDANRVDAYHLEEPLYVRDFKGTY